MASVCHCAPHRARVVSRGEQGRSRLKTRKQGGSSASDNSFFFFERDGEQEIGIIGLWFAYILSKLDYLFIYWGSHLFLCYP